jgi:hypothetical protein
MMPSEPGPLPEVWTPNHAVDDSELEWLLCLASSFQACQRSADKDVELSPCPEAIDNRGAPNNAKSGIR